MKNIITSLSLLSVLSMSTLCFGMEKDKSEEVLSKEFFQTDLFAQVKMVQEKADAEYKAGFKQFLQDRLVAAVKDEACDLASAASYAPWMAVWGGQSGIHSDPRLNDNSKRTIMAAYALAAGAGMEALKCMKAGCCCVESDSKFNLAEAYGLRRVSQAEYRRNPLYEINKSIGPDLLAQASRTLAQILLKELGEENK